jgi:hypothetical protein
MSGVEGSYDGGCDVEMRRAFFLMNLGIFGGRFRPFRF